MAGEFVLYLIGINVLTFLLYGIDKWKARRGKWRIPEDTLIWLAIVGGSIGALLGMNLFRHKTQHKKFTLGVPAILYDQPPSAHRSGRKAIRSVSVQFCSGYQRIFR
jgi:uncharacterized membrane protein YsdA (DUF1294 family)